MNLEEALRIVIDYLEERQVNYGERHPSLPSLKAYLLDEQESAGLEGKTKAELIQMIKGRKKLEGPVVLPIPERPSPEAPRKTDTPIHNQVAEELTKKSMPEATQNRRTPMAVEDDA